MPDDTLVRMLPDYMPASLIFNLFHAEDGAVFLDSSSGSPSERYSIIGLNPYLCLVQKDGQLSINGIPSQEDFSCCLTRLLHEGRQKNPTSLPLVAGAIGYFSYDYGIGLENFRSRHSKEPDVPDCIWNFYDNFIIEDLTEKKVYITGNGMLEPAECSIAGIERKLAWGLDVENPATEPVDPCGGIVSDFEKTEYADTVQRLIDYIIEGDVYIANLTQRFLIKSSLHPYDFFRRLRRQTPSPFGGYMNYGDFQIVSASPESFLNLMNGNVTTRPIKGTRKRGTTPGEDLALRLELENSEKDRSELLMIVDLERNDLNRICLENTVRVNDLFRVEEHSSVFHLTAEVSGRLKAGTTVMDLVRAAFPGGSITGAPKIRAIEIIDELERTGRGIYTGSMGYISLSGDCELNIIIRTAICKNGHYHLGAGGGVTCESDPDFEHEETLLKAGSVIRPLTL